MKYISVIISIVLLMGCIKTENQYYEEQGIHFMTPEESKKFHDNHLMINLDDRGYLMLTGNINGVPFSANLDSISMQMHNDRSKSYNIYDERIAKNTVNQSNKP